MGGEELVHGTTIEQLPAEEGLPMFFWWAELVHPEGVQQLTTLVSAIATQSSSATEQDIQEGLTEENLNLGFDVISSWLDEVGAGGFRSINILKRKALLAGAVVKGIRLPKKESITEEGIKILKPFSAMVKKAEVHGMMPVWIIEELLRESVGSRLSADGSANLREALNKPLGGHFEWIREALKIPDVAGQPGFTGKETLSATAAKRDEPIGKKDITPAEKELPAFLKGDELPEGYQWVDFPNEKEQEVALGEREGSTIVCYIQGLGVRLTRGPRDITFFRFLGISLPRDIAPTQRGIPLSESEESVLIVEAEDNREKSVQLHRTSRYNFLTFPFQTMIRDGSKDFPIPDLGSLGISFRMRPTENSRGNIWMRNENINYGSIDRIAIPSTAIVRGRVEPKTAATQTETDLTSEERMMIDGLGIVAAWERNEPNAKLTDFAKFSGETNEQHLQTTFRNLQFSFYLLPADSRLRAEIIKSALGQLGETGERLRETGKNDEEIFAEWLRQVFLALYRRAVKK